MRRPRKIVLALLLVIGAGACGDSDDSADTDAASGDSSTTTAAVAPGAEATVATGNTSLGEILVDGRGRTLYLFTKDSESKSACEDACADLWPPLVAGRARADGGVDGTKLGTLTRGDGTTQVTYAGHPLYTYAQDSAPGDVTGQNVGGVWFAVRADGTAVPASA